MLKVAASVTATGGEMLTPSEGGCALSFAGSQQPYQDLPVGGWTNSSRTRGVLPSSARAQATLTGKAELVPGVEHGAPIVLLQRFILSLVRVVSPPLG